MTIDAAYELVNATHRNGRMPHAYLICGDPRGDGLRLAEHICALLLCSSEESERPCGKCPDCINAQGHKHADAIWIEPESKSRIISGNVVKEEIVPWATKGSYAGGWMVCTLLFADRLNETSSNALLKTLEEPAEQTLFLLVTEKQEGLLPTIVSRCQKLDLGAGRIPPPEPWRTRVGEIMSRHSNTSAVRVMATAGRLVDVFAEIKDKAEELANEKLAQRSDSEPDVDDGVFSAWIGAFTREMRQAVFQSLLDWYRDMLVLSSGEDSSAASLFYPEFREAIQSAATGLQPARAMQYINFVYEMEKQVEVRNMREDIVFPYWLTWMK